MKQQGGFFIYCLWILSACGYFGFFSPEKLSHAGILVREIELLLAAEPIGLA